MNKQSSVINRLKSYRFFNDNKFLVAFLCVILTIIMVSVFQDYLQSKRNSYPFFFSESLLFKSFWLLFLVTLMLLKNVLHNRKYQTHVVMGFILVIYVVIHVLLTSVTVWGLSVIFRDQSYGIIKVLTYTLANDLVKILLVYGFFIYGLKYVIDNSHKGESVDQMLGVHDPDALKIHVNGEKKHKPEAINLTNYLIINSGKNNTRINQSDILYVQSATPYVSIHVQDKEYLESTTLKSIAERLDIRFIRVHRSSIVNLEKVLSYQSRLNGDYDLILDDGTEIRLSRNYVKAFRKRFASTPQLKT